MHVSQTLWPWRRSKLTGFPSSPGLPWNTQEKPSGTGWAAPQLGSGSGPLPSKPRQHWAPTGGGLSAWWGRRPSPGLRRQALGCPGCASLKPYSCPEGQQAAIGAGAVLRAPKPKDPAALPQQPPPPAPHPGRTPGTCTHGLAVLPRAAIPPRRPGGPRGALWPRNRLCFGAPHCCACRALGINWAGQDPSAWLLFLPLHASLGTMGRGHRLRSPRHAAASTPHVLGMGGDTEEGAEPGARPAVWVGGAAPAPGCSRGSGHSRPTWRPHLSAGSELGRQRHRQMSPGSALGCPSQHQPPTRHSPVLPPLTAPLQGLVCISALLP